MNRDEDDGIVDGDFLDQDLKKTQGVLVVVLGDEEFHTIQQDDGIGAALQKVDNDIMDFSKVRVPDGIFVSFFNGEPENPRALHVVSDFDLFWEDP